MMSSTMDLSELSAKVALTETESLELQKKVTALIEDAEDAELTSLRTQNSKLKYRKEFLRKVIAEKSQPNGTTAKPNRGTMESMLQSIREIFDVAVKKAYPELENPPVDIGKSSRQEVDYQCNSALQLSKLLKGTGKPSNPREIAASLVSNVPASDIIAKLEIAGPGFINIYIDEKYLSRQIKNILTNGISIRKADSVKRIIVDYSAPNVAKEMHVGHLRSTIIGDCFANVFEFLGYEDVIRLNHLGDWGTQFGMLLTHLIEKFPNYMAEPPPIGDLQAFYRESKQRFDEDEAFKKRAYAAVVSLQSKEPESYKAWQLICDVSRREFQDVYRRLNLVKPIIERGESFYQDLMTEVVPDLEKRGFLVDDNGRKIMWPSSKVVGIPLTIVKSDGGYTYDTSDMACIKHRAQIVKADRVIYVTDLGQYPHFQIIWACAKDCGYWEPEKTRLDHVGFGVVLGEDGKRFKTRSGEVVRLRDLLDEGMDRALAKLIEKGRDKVLSEAELKAAQEAVAIGCIKYADLSHDRNHDYEFSFDRMLDDRGNTAVYLLYCLTRIRSISRNANLEKSSAERAGELDSIKLEHEKELKLAKYILKFPEIILQLAEDLYPHSLCGYLYELSAVYSEFYDKCYCIEKYVENGEQKTRINMSRILLCDATALVMEKGLELLGIKTLSKM